MANRRLSVSVGFCLMLSLMLLLMPLRWLFSAVVAAILHEFCHYIVILLFCGRVAGVKFYAFGARMPLPEMSRCREFLCAMAGPAGGLLLTLLAPIFPRLAICGFLQSVYNLLPIYPLDGGRMLSALLSMLFFPPKAAGLLRFTEICTKIGIGILGLYCCFFLNWGIFPLFIAVLICIRAK